MSLHETKRKNRSLPLHRIAIMGLLLSLATISACTVRPLYSRVGTEAGASTGTVTGLPPVTIKPVESRYAQQVRNQLIFLMNGGAGQPAEALYALNLVVTRLTEASVSRQRRTQDEPTAETVTLLASYTLTYVSNGRAISKGKRQISSSFDTPLQEFAVVRAQIDAENRAARELAELLNLAVSQDLLKLQRTAAAVK